MSGRALDVLGRILDDGGEPDDALRATVSALVDEPGVVWAGIAFLEEGELVVGPHTGEADEGRRTRVPISFQGALVGELWVDGEVESAFLQQVARLISGHVLIGWDTRGEAWKP